MVITFRLEGPLQSWGDHSKLNYRDTSNYPTKSGVVGLIACAMGLLRDDPKIPEMCKNLTMAVRADRKGTIMVDYHNVTETVQGDGGHAKRTLQTWRNYLADASFLVVLEGPDELLEEIIEAFNKPCWAPYLGRKSCTPSVPIMATRTNKSLMGALNDAATLADRHDEIVYCEVESQAGVWKNDVFLPRLRKSDPNYGRRKVQTIRADF